VKHTHQCDGFEVRYTVADGGYEMYFQVVRDDDDEDGDDGDDGFEPMLHGFIKWDGCINVSMGKSCMQHFCSLEETQDVGRAFAAVYALAAEKIPKWDRLPADQ